MIRTLTSWGLGRVRRKVSHKHKIQVKKALVKWGIGVDAIDVEAAGDLGVRFANTPGMFSHEVADVAIGYVIMLFYLVPVIFAVIDEFLG